VSIGAAGPPLKLSVNPLAVLICLPEVCRKLTQAPLAKGVSGSGSQTTVIETVINCRPVNVGDAPMMIVFVAAFAGVTVAATSSAPIPMAVASLNLIAPLPWYLRLSAVDGRHPAPLGGLSSYEGDLAKESILILCGTRSLFLADNDRLT
jgi:hypothetical protein